MNPAIANKGNIQFEFINDFLKLITNITIRTTQTTPYEEPKKALVES